jgi:hypothetical protein
MYSCRSSGRKGDPKIATTIERSGENCELYHRVNVVNQLESEYKKIKSELKEFI